MQVQNSLKIWKWAPWLMQTVLVTRFLCVAERSTRAGHAECPIGHRRIGPTRWRWTIQYYCTGRNCCQSSWRSTFRSKDLLIRMPGVTFKNLKLIMNRVENLRQLGQLSESQLTTIMGNSKQASMLYEFIHKRKDDLAVDIKSKAAATKTWKKRC